MIDLNNYRVAADEPSADAPIVALVREACSQSSGSGDVRWWDRDYRPSIVELVAEAQLHEKQAHKPKQQGGPG